MRLAEVLRDKRAEVVEKWVDAIVRTYPAVTAEFLKRKKDQFLNPVGHTIRTETAKIVEQLVEAEPSAESVGEFLDRLIRVRAIQDFTPAQALGFIFELKGIIRDVLGEELGVELLGELREMERRIDRLALLAFDIYVGCKEQVYQIRVKEIQNNTFMLLKRAGMLVELDQPNPDS